MATRATYNICGTVFYCHWDGYPAGAAERFANMIAAHTEAEDGSRRQIEAIKDKRGGWPFAFIRGNDDAEGIASHDEIGGTEWRYDLEESNEHGLTIRVRSTSYDFKTWKECGRFPLAEWINRERNDEAFGTPRIVCRRTTDDERRYWNPPAQLATLPEAEKIAQRETELAERFQPGNPNKPHHEQRAAAWREAVAELLTPA